jgi:hypothetical protein
VMFQWQIPLTQIGLNSEMNFKGTV